jgi:hypothetical protein
LQAIRNANGRRGDTDTIEWRRGAELLVYVNKEKRREKEGENTTTVVPGACFACTIRNPSLCQRESCGVSGAILRRQSYMS